MAANHWPVPRLRARSRHLLAGGLTALVVLALLPAGAPASGPPPKTNGFKRDVSYLFEIGAREGTLTRRDGKHLTLRLVHAGPFVTRFSDRPVRQSAAIYARDFVSIWRKAFASSGPNASLSFVTAPGARPRSIVLTLGPPRYLASRHEWRFPATRIRRQGPRRKAKEVMLPKASTPRSFRSASLFIDESFETDNAPPTTCEFTDTSKISWHVVIGRDGWVEGTNCAVAEVIVDFSSQGMMVENWSYRQCSPDTHFPLNFWRLYWRSEEEFFFAWPLAGMPAVDPNSPTVEFEIQPGVYAPCGTGDEETWGGGIGARM